MTCVQALVAACPTWSWEAGAPSRARSFLPPDKQYLVTKNVPCYRRAAESEEARVPSFEGAGDDDAWQSPSSFSLTGEASASGFPPPTPPIIPDISASRAGAAEEEDDLAAPRPPASAILKTRTYSVSVTYDKFYAVPRIWLVGYDEARRLLSPRDMLADVSVVHALKTVTIDPHPHLEGTPAVSIHPCRHAAVLKLLAEQLAEAGENVSVLCIFLRFCQSALPTLDYDYTM